MAGLLQRSLSISPAETTFARRKFHFSRDSTRQTLEKVGETFLHGYHLALFDQEIDSMVAHLAEIDPEFRGFGFEGAAMGLDILDQLKPWKECRIDNLLRDAGKRHVYMVHVGVGWSMARCRIGIGRRFARLDPLLKWLALDGFGFHEGYFNWPHYAEGGRAPAVIRGYGQRAFDQGLGRSLWFVGGADPDYIISAIQQFPEQRRDDLWSGVGLACTYAGGAEASEIHALRLASGRAWIHLAQGAAFAAAARLRAGNLTAQTELSCQVLCRLSADEAAETCNQSLANLAPDDGAPAYEIWRYLIREKMMAIERGNDLPHSHSQFARVSSGL